MDEYISKTKFEELMRKKARSNFDLYYVDKAKHYHDKAIGYNTAADEAHDFPTADVQPVSYGRWIDIYEWAKMHDSTPSGMCLYYWCSECQKEQEKKSNFCPNCGAKMIEGCNENDTL